jgi:serine/threonine-protein kinase
VLQRLLAAPLPTGLTIDTPLPGFLEAASGIGVRETHRDGQRVHGVPLVIKAGDRYLPGFELRLFAAASGIDATGLTVSAGKPLGAAGSSSIGTPDQAYYPQPAAAVPVYSLQEVLRSDQLAEELRGKTLLLGLTAPGLVPALKGPAGQRYTPVTWSAQVVGGLLRGDGFAMPAWFHGGQRLLILLSAIYLILVPACWHGKRSPIVSGLVALALLNTGLAALIVKGLWLPVIAPTAFLLTTQLLLSLAYRRWKTLVTARQGEIEARLALGSNLQSQGQLDSAMQQFTHCLPAGPALESLYELGLEYERRRQIGKALAVYEQLETSSGVFRDTARRRAQLSELSGRFPNANAAGVNKTLVLDAPVMELPVLGRYRLERELGRGAMGTVYLAQDPTIGRQVAIKTLPLLEHYEAREQEEAAQRFFREAEAVGRLDHPNIVTVYDAGREHDLAYMSMDYVAGDSLEEWTDKSVLLPVWEVLEIAAQVADALDYAHSHKVVHRDIKPSNIIYDRDSGVVKITDFGVARILDASRTRTGTVLGTPSYMSPEQVAGNNADGRSDLFSLGVTVYQLLTGSLPFKGDSVAALMYQIANQKTPPMRNVRRGLPACATRLVTRALQKQPAKRFAGGEEMAVSIRKCRSQLRGGRRKTA